MKTDASAFERFINQQRQDQHYLLSTRSEWPGRLYHYTDIRNAVSVLIEGFIHSREHLITHGINFIDTRPDRVLQYTVPAVISCARLTFRPQTPTQYHHEGIKTQAVLSGPGDFASTHCPAPVFFVFEALPILVRTETRFSATGLGALGAVQLSTSDEFASLPWRDIYSVGPGNQPVFPRRNAEVIVPNRLDLSNLLRVHCRSIAEKETLLYLLPGVIRENFLGLITSTSREPMFHRRRTYIQTADLASDKVVLNFSPDTNCPGPYELKVIVKDLVIGSSVEMIETLQLANQSVALSIPGASNNYSIECYLDGSLAYANVYATKRSIFSA